MELNQIAKQIIKLPKLEKDQAVLWNLTGRRSLMQFIKQWKQLVSKDLDPRLYSNPNDG